MHHRRMKTRLLPLAALALVMSAAGACLSPLQPPEPTEMAKVETGLVFEFGTETFCVADGVAPDKRPTCDIDNTEEIPAYWPTVKVRLEPFEIDEHEVTNLQYEYCVAQKACSRDKDQACNAVEGDQAKGDYCDNPSYWDYPVVNVTWDQAGEYCAFVGKRLPSEFEWERVARGNPTLGEDRPYPAEGVLATKQCKDNEMTSILCRGNQLFDPVDEAGFDWVLEQGHKVSHLFGNAAEWVSDWYAANTTCLTDDVTGESIRPCKPAAECGIGDTDCTNDATKCPACIDDEAPTPPTAEQTECFYLCGKKGEDRRDIVCERHPSDRNGDGKVDEDDAYAPSDISPKGGDRKAIRGGSVVYNENSSCRFRSTGRNSEQRTASKTFIGFRCARDL